MYSPKPTTPQGTSKEELLREWDSAFDAQGEPPVMREKDGSVTVGQETPLVENFRSASESFRVMLEAY